MFGYSLNTTYQVHVCNYTRKMKKNELYFSKFYCAARMCYGNSEYSLIFLRLKQIVKCQEKDFCTILICSKPTYKCIYSKTTVMWSLQYISLQFINHFYIRHFKEKLRFCNLKKNAAHIAIGIKNRQQESFSLLIWNTSSFRIRYDKSAICANCLNYLCD